jgi:ribosomal protein RSM22 (predicted rRNA methylase)
VNEALRVAVEDLVAGASTKSLARSSAALSLRYRLRGAGCVSEQDRLAYLSVRLPATYAALIQMLGSVTRSVETVLDLGAGPGTGAWAAREVFPELQRAILVEKDAAMIALGKQLSCCLPLACEWICADLRHPPVLPAACLVLLSYVVGELPSEGLLPLLRTAWDAARETLAVIEPGTPEGFARMRRVREALIEWGAHLAAPCPHSGACPMAQGDWCHFAARVNRSALHRTVKEAERNYEDEKYTYLVAVRSPVEPVQARILRHPKKRSGHVSLTLCTQEGLQDVTLSKKQGSLYREVRDKKWGDSIHK